MPRGYRCINCGYIQLFDKSQKKVIDRVIEVFGCNLKARLCDDCISKYCD